MIQRLLSNRIPGKKGFAGAGGQTARSLCVLVLSLSFGAAGVVAQDLPIGNYHVYEDVAKGLIKGLVVDTTGYVWIATDEGVFRYDGASSAYYKDELKGGFAKDLLRLQGGRLLLAHDNGLTEIDPRIDTPVFRPLLSDTADRTDDAFYFPKSLFQDKNGDVWIGEDDGISRFADGRIFRYALPDLGTNNNIFRNFSFQEDPYGGLWAISYGGEVFCFSRESDRFFRASLPAPLREVSCLLRAPDGRLLVGAGVGAYALTVGPGYELVDWRPLPGPERISCGQLIENQLYWGTWDRGLYRVTPAGQVQRLGARAFEMIVDLHFDSRSGLWVVGEEAVATLTPGFFQELKLTTSGLPISSLALLPDSSLLIASGATLDQVYKDKGGWRVQPLPVEPADQTKTALLGVADGIWMGMIGGEIWFYDYRTKEATPLPGIVANNKVTQLKQDRRGNVWAAGNERQGLLRIAADRTLRFYDAGAQPLIRAIYESASGRLLFGGADPDRFLFFYYPLLDSLVDISRPLPFPVKQNFAVHQLLDGEDGQLWLATSHGLLQYRYSPSWREAGITRLHLQEIPEDEPILAMERTPDGALWLSTNEGLIRYHEKEVLLYDRYSGLPGNTLTQRGLVVDYEGNVWVAASRGAAVLRSRISGFSSRTPRPVITRVRINALERHFRGKSKLAAPAGGNLEFSYFSPAFPPMGMVYQTRLKGARTTRWSDGTTDRSVLLHGVDPGNYHFEVRARRAGGFEWSEPAALPFRVLRPWYLSWWGIALLAVALFAVIVLVARLYNLQLLRQKKLLSRLVKERTQDIMRQNQKIMDQQERYRALQEKQLQEKIESRNKELTTYTLHLIQKNRALQMLQTGLYHFLRHTGGKNRKEINQLLSLIDFSFRNDEEWERFKLYFESVHPGFFEKLIAGHPHLTAQELRLCTLIRLNLSSAEIASILGISPESVKTSRFRLRKKLEIDSASEMVEYLLTL